MSLAVSPAARPTIAVAAGSSGVVTGVLGDGVLGVGITPGGTVGEVVEGGVVVIGSVAGVVPAVVLPTMAILFEGGGGTGSVTCRAFASTNCGVPFGVLALDGRMHPTMMTGLTERCAAASCAGCAAIPIAAEATAAPAHDHFRRARLARVTNPGGVAYRISP